MAFTVHVALALMLIACYQAADAQGFIKRCVSSDRANINCTPFCNSTTEIWIPDGFFFDSVEQCNSYFASIMCYRANAIPSVKCQSDIKDCNGTVVSTTATFTQSTQQRSLLACKFSVCKPAPNVSLCSDSTIDGFYCTTEQCPETTVATYPTSAQSSAISACLRVVATNPPVDLCFDTVQGNTCTQNCSGLVIDKLLSMADCQTLLTMTSGAGGCQNVTIHGRQMINGSQFTVSQYTRLTITTTASFFFVSVSPSDFRASDTGLVEGNNYIVDLVLPSGDYSIAATFRASAQVDRSSQICFFLRNANSMPNCADNGGVQTVTYSIYNRVGSCMIPVVGNATQVSFNVTATSANIYYGVDFLPVVKSQPFKPASQTLPNVVANVTTLSIVYALFRSLDGNVVEFSVL